MSKEFISEVSRMKDLFGYKKGQVISEQSYVLNEQTTPKQKEALDAGWGPVTDDYAKSLPVDANGRIIPNKIEPSTPAQTNVQTNVQTPAQTNVQTPAQTKTQTPVQTKTNWINEPDVLDNDKNTLKKGMMGSKVKELQNSLVIKGRAGKRLVTGKFWNLTDATLKQLLPQEYTTEKGLTLDLFNQLTHNLPLKSNNTQVTSNQGQVNTNLVPQQLKTQQTDLSLKNITTPENYYKSLYDAGLIQGEASTEGDNRVRYKGPELSKEQQDLLTQAMNNLGYNFYRKGDDKRLVYRKK